MLTKEQLKEGLEEISISTAKHNDVDRVEFVRVNYFPFHNSSYKYNAEVIIYLNSSHSVGYFDNYAEKWVKKFSVLTKNSWSSMPWASRKRLPYRRGFTCHFKTHSAQSETYTKVTQNLIKLAGGPPECLNNIIFIFSLPRSKRIKGSFINIKIHTTYCKRIYIQNYLMELASGDNSFTQKYMCDVISDPPVDQSEPLVRLDEVYYRYFADGHTFRTAKMLHLLSLICEYGNNAKIFSDPTKNPTMSYVCNVNKHYKSYVKDILVDFEIIMSRKQAEMEKIGGLISFNSQDMVTIITPTMKRVLCSCELDEVIISNTLVSQGPIVTLFFIPNKVGALCFACVIHKTQVGYLKAFSTIKAIIENNCSKSFNPHSVIISDISLMEPRTAAESVFQNSKIFVSPWPLCSAAWIWICSTKSTTKRFWHEAMISFHEVMNATSIELGHEKFKAFVSTVGSLDLYFFRDYFDEIWKQYSLHNWWSTANNSLVALSIILLQQLLIQKCASFDVVQVCDVIITLDKHFQNILLNWVDKKQPILKIHSMFLDKSELKGLKLQLLSPREFLLDNGFQTKLRTDTWCCDCVPGRRSLYCEHICTLLYHADVTLELSCDEKHFLKQIAGENDNFANGNCVDVNKFHPTYTDGYYLFHIPIDINVQFTCSRRNFDFSLPDKKSYNFVINNMTKKCKPTTYSEGFQNKGVETRLDINKPETGRGNVDIAQKNKPQQHKSNSKLQLENEETETLYTERTDVPSTHVIEECDNRKNNSDCNIKVEKTFDSNSDNKAGLHHEVNLDIDIIHTETDKADENVLEEVTSTFVDASSSVNDFEAEYKNALNNLRDKYRKFSDVLRMRSSSNRLESILQLTKEFSTTKTQLIGIKSEPEEPKV